MVVVMVMQLLQRRHSQRLLQVLRKLRMDSARFSVTRMMHGNQLVSNNISVWSPPFVCDLTSFVGCASQFWFQNSLVWNCLRFLCNWVFDVCIHEVEDRWIFCRRFITFQLISYLYTLWTAFPNSQLLCSLVSIQVGWYGGSLLWRRSLPFEHLIPMTNILLSSGMCEFIRWTTGWCAAVVKNCTLRFWRLAQPFLPSHSGAKCCINQFACIVGHVWIIRCDNLKYSGIRGSEDYRLVLLAHFDVRLRSYLFNTLPRRCGAKLSIVICDHRQVMQQDAKYAQFFQTIVRGVVSKKKFNQSVYENLRFETSVSDRHLFRHNLAPCGLCNTHYLGLVVAELPG